MKVFVVTLALIAVLAHAVPIAQVPAEEAAPVAVAVPEPAAKVEAEAPRVAEQKKVEEAEKAEATAKKTEVAEPTAEKTKVVEEPVAEKTAVVEEPVAAKTAVVEEPVAAKTTVVEEPVAEKTKVVEEPATKKTEAEAVTKTEAATKTEETATKTEETATKTEETAEATPSKLETVKDEAINQVMSFISEMAVPMSGEEHDALRDILSTGGDILMQAEKKARELSALPEIQNLIQTTSDTGLFGLQADGTINPTAAADQMTDLLSKMAAPSNPLSGDEKAVLHDLISGFSHAFAPTKETTASLQKDFEKLVDTFSEQAKASNVDEMLGATNLLNVFSEGKTGFDTKLLTDLTEKFLTNMEKQFSSEESK